MPQQFIPATNVKITIEKPVKPKPSTEELTTIESPGKPIPASLIEKRKKASQSSKTSKKTKPAIEKKEITKKDAILIITEKPQAAQKIANALSPTAKKYSEDGVSFYELTHNNEKIIVASAVGHLFNLTYSDGQKGWPIFKLEWVPSYKRKTSAFTKKYFDMLKKLSKRAKEIIIASDYDTEGEVIGWNVLRFIFNKQSAKRMKFSTLTAEELRKSYENPLPELDWNQAYAGETRHYIDWLYGINLSRALMSAIKKAGSFKVLSIGRVQGPALKIIVDKEKEIEKFKPKPYWQVFAIANNIEFIYPKDIFNKEDLKKFENIKEAEATTKKEEEKLIPPAPFDLTTLQTEAYRLHKISPSETLKIAQQLYLDGIISYPRTSSQKIPQSIEPKKILLKLSRHFSEVKEATREKPIEGKKSDPAHPSIYPTGEYMELSGKEKNLYELIVKRFISVFAKDALIETKKITLVPTKTKDKDIKFVASGLTIKEKGWTKIYPTKLEEKKLPDLDGKVKIDKIKFEEKETQPPKRYTPASLISTLEKKNLGTKATRSLIVDTLYERGYLDGKSIKATPLGLKLIETLEKDSPIIIDEKLTRELEEEMDKIQKAKSIPEQLEKKEKEVIAKAEKTITEISKQFKTKEEEIGKSILSALETQRKEEQEANTIIQCPVCKKGNLRILFNRASYRYFVACSSYPECKNTYTLPPNALIKKSDKTCEECNFPKLMAIRKGKRPWEFCFNKDCPIVKKQLEEWRAKQKDKQNKESEKTTT
ncbi:MAG: DNA topoisomerase I [Candidatus Pacearchaeota archaeon]|nr:DNA topoisomerase I [Candidatus Pacearchaeota archaeon]